MRQFFERSSPFFSEEALESIERAGDDLARWWARAPRGDFMLWVAAKKGVEPRLLVLAACACCRIPSAQWPARKRRRALHAIETAESWAHGRATGADCRRASDALYEAMQGALDVSSASMNAAEAIANAAALYDAAAPSEPEPAFFAAQAIRRVVNAAGFENEKTQRKVERQTAEIVRKMIPLELIPSGSDG